MQRGLQPSHVFLQGEREFSYLRMVPTIYFLFSEKNKELNKFSSRWLQLKLTFLHPHLPEQYYALGFLLGRPEKRLSFLGLS